MRFMNRRLGLAVLTVLVASFGAGCPGCETVPPSSDAGPGPSVTFVAPPASINCSDDLDAQTAGEQLEIEVQLVNDDGSGFDTVTVKTGAEEKTGAFDESGRATVVVTLSGGAAPGVDNVLTASTTNGTDTLEAPPVTIADACEPVEPTPAACAFESPAAGTFTSSVLPVRVRMSGGDPNDTALQTALRTGDIRIDAAPGGRSQVLQAAAFLAQGDIDVVDNGTFALTATVVGTDPAVTCSVADVVVDVPPVADTIITFPEDGATYGAADDTDNDPNNGVSLALTGTSTVNGVPSTFSVVCGNQPPQTGALSLVAQGGLFVFTAPLEDLVGPECTVTVSVAGTAPASVTFAIDAAGVPVLGFTLAPDANTDGFYDVEDDTVAGTTAVIDVPLTVTPTLPAGTWTGEVVVEDADGNPVGAPLSLGALTDGVDADAVLALPVGDAVTYSFTIVATEAGGGTTAPFGGTVTVDTVAPTVDYFFPNASLDANVSNDVDPATDGLQIRLALSVSPDVVECTITMDGISQSGTVTGTLCTAVAPAIDGPHTFAGSATDGAGHVTDAPPITFEADGSIPAIESIVVVDAGADNVLNVADHGGAASGDVTSGVTVTTTDDLNARTIRLTGPAGTATAVVANATATFPAFRLRQGDNDLVVTGSDAGGNVIAAAGSTLTVVVDTIAPTLRIESPLAGTLNAGADLDAGTAGLQIDVVVASDAGDGRSVQVLDNGTAAGTGALAGGTATVRVTVGEGARSLTATTADAANNGVTADAVAVAVDSVAPALVLVAGNVTSADDVDGVATNGIQVDLTVTPTGLTAGRLITIESDREGTISDGTCLSQGEGVAVACRVTYIADGAHQLTASALDEAGNLGSSSPVAVTAGTGLFFVDVDVPPLRAGFRSVGVAEDLDPVAPGAQLVVTGVTDAPAGSAVAVLINGIASNVGTVGAGGVIEVNLTLGDGSSGTFEVTVTDVSGFGSSGQDPFRVDLRRPTATFTNPATATVTFARANDLQLGVPGLQVDVTVAVTGCENGEARVLDGSTTIGAAPVDASGTATLTLRASDLTEGDGETWTATCVDAEGNAPLTPDTLTATVDVTAPGAPALALTVVDARAGTVRIAWVQPGDSGTTGNAASVELFFQKNAAIADATFGGAGQIAVTVPQGDVAGGTSVSAEVTGLAFDNTWHAALRATDDVGNRSVLASAQIDVATSELVLAPPAGVTGWAQALSRSRRDINGDGFEDIVVGAPNGGSGAVGGFEVILGAATAAEITRTFVPAPTTLACVAPPCDTQEAGWGVNILPSLDGDEFDDVLVVAYDDRGGPLGGGESPEFLLIYRGGANGIAADATPAGVLELTDTTFPAFAAFSAEGVGDVDNDGDEDWAFTAPLLGLAYLYLNDGAIPTGTVAATAATVISNSDFTNFFAFGAAQAGAGKNGDGFDDFVITCQDTPALFVVRGRAAWPATLDLNGLAGNDFVPLAQPVAESPAWDLSAGDVDGDGLVDLAYLARNGVHVVRGTGATWSGETSYTATPTLLIIGAGLAVASLNGDNRADVVVGGRTPASAFFGASPLSSKAADVTYPITATAGDWLSFQATNLIGSSPAPDLVIASSVAPGTVTIRF